MTSLKRGDKVKAIVEINNGIFKPNVKQGAVGTVLGTRWGNDVEVHFPSAGIVWPEVTCVVNSNFLDKV